MRSRPLVYLAALLSLGLNPPVQAQSTASDIHNGNGGQNITLTDPAEIARDARQRQLTDTAAAALKAEDYARAEASARQALALGQAMDRANGILEQALYYQGKTQEALKQYQFMEDRSDHTPEVLLRYARLLVQTGQWPKAVAAYDKAVADLTAGGAVYWAVPWTIQVSPSVPQPVRLAAAIHVALGVTEIGHHGGQGRLDKHAVEDFQAAVTLTPDSEMANYYLGYGLAEAGRREEAQAAFQRAIENGHGAGKLAALKALSTLKKGV